MVKQHRTITLKTRFFPFPWGRRVQNTGIQPIINVNVETNHRFLSNPPCPDHVLNHGCSTSFSPSFSPRTWRRLNEALPVAGVALAAARPEVPRQAAVAHAAALPSANPGSQNKGRAARFFFRGQLVNVAKDSTGMSSMKIRSDFLGRFDRISPGHLQPLGRLP